MSITEEQFQTFNDNFYIKEKTRAIVESTATLNLEDFENYKDQPDDFFLATNWTEYTTDVIKSEGYYIEYWMTNEFVKSITDLNDVADFIVNEMDAYLAEMEN